MCLTIHFPSHPHWLDRCNLLLGAHTYHGNVSDKHNFNIFRFKTKVRLMSESRHFSRWFVTWKQKRRNL
jgi:hypothetical protein